MAFTAASTSTVLAMEASRLGPDIYRKTVDTGPWQKLIKQSSWPEEMGDVISSLTYQRSIPDTKLNWVPIVGNALGGTSTVGGYSGQLPPVAAIDFATSLVTYGLQHTSIESPAFDVNSLRYSFKRKEQLTKIFDILRDATRWSWDERKRDEYIRICSRKLVIGQTVGVSSGVALLESSLAPTALATNNQAYIPNALAFPQVAPVSELTQSVLSNLRMRLIRDGAGNNPLGRENGAPIFGLICSSETSERLILSNALARTDINYAMPSELLKPLGVERSYKGFYHLIDDFMPRFKWSGLAAGSSAGNLTVAGVTITGNTAGTVTTSAAHNLVVGDYFAIKNSATAAQNNDATTPAWIVLTAPSSTTFTYATLAAPTVAITSGNGATTGDIFCFVEVRPYIKTSGVWGINAAYQDAPFEMSIIFHQDVYEMLMPAPITAPGGGTKFDPVSYRGDFTFLNIKNGDTASAAYNPDGTIGRFRGVLASGSKPNRAEWGYVMIHQRPSQTVELVNAINGTVTTATTINEAVDRITLADNNESGEGAGAA